LYSNCLRNSPKEASVTDLASLVLARRVLQKYTDKEVT
jgi:hypothetical protein